ncbi:MAG: hypothetical protein LBL58_10180 [Tannerellaceae bacterium]|nr:hypothetical protein [Tannerellaceae bacterium]
MDGLLKLVGTVVWLSVHGLALNVRVRRGGEMESDERTVDWEKESRKRSQWEKDNGYWYSCQGGLEPGCGNCIHWKDWHCEIIPCLVNRVDLFSGCRLKEEVKK